MPPSPPAVEVKDEHLLAAFSLHLVLLWLGRFPLIWVRVDGFVRLGTILELRLVDIPRQVLFVVGKANEMLKCWEQLKKAQSSISVVNESNVPGLVEVVYKHLDESFYSFQSLKSV